MPADGSDAACTVAGVRKPPRNEPAGNGRRWRRERRALWRFAHDGGARGPPTPMSVLADDVAAHDWSVTGAGICGKPGRSMATLTWQRHICTSAAVADRGPARKRRGQALPEPTASMDQVSPPAKISFLMTAWTPQFPSTTWVMPKSTPIVIREIASSSVSFLVVIKNLRILRNASRKARSTDDFE